MDSSEDRSIKQFTKDSDLFREIQLRNDLSKNSVKLASFHTAEKLVGFIEFTSPAKALQKNTYTVELKQLESLCIKNSYEIKLELINEYIELYNPSDFFMNSKIAKANMKIVKELKLSYKASIDGDIYIWINKNCSFYTYRTTAEDSDKYYYGVRRINKANATVEDCMKDKYFGSGGKASNNKFKNWSKKHRSKLKKEILGVYSLRSDAFAHEKELIGELWAVDSKCLNSRSGGAMSPPTSLENNRFSVCDIHGSGGFIGESCRSCILKAQETTDECEHHGYVSHFAGHCRICLYESSARIDICNVHGETLFQNKNCLKCLSAKKISYRDCEIHGERKHIGELCAKCSTSNVFSLKQCSVHGDSKFVGAKCSKCIHEKSFYLAKCSIHGESKHKGGKCFKCNLAKAWSKQDCVIHGALVTFQGKKCLRCSREKAKITLEEWQ